MSTDLDPPHGSTVPSKQHNRNIYVYQIIFYCVGWARDFASKSKAHSELSETSKMELLPQIYMTESPELFLEKTSFYIFDWVLNKLLTTEFKPFPMSFKTFFYYLTHFSPMSHFYTPWKHQKTCGFLTFSRGIEIWHWIKMD